VARHAMVETSLRGHARQPGDRGVQSHHGAGRHTAARPDHSPSRRTAAR